MATPERLSAAPPARGVRLPWRQLPPKLRDAIERAAGSPITGVTERTGRLVDADGEKPVSIERGDYPAFYRQVVDWLNAHRTGTGDQPAPARGPAELSRSS